MKKWLYRNNFHILIVFVAVAWILVFDWLTQISSQGIIYNDSTSYLESAKNLYHSFQSHQYRPILMAAITGIPLVLSNSDTLVYEFSFFVNAACWIGSAVLVFEIAALYVPRRVGFSLALLFIFLIGGVSCIFHLLTENIYLFVILLAFYNMASFFKTNEFIRLAVAISLLIVSMLIKPGTMYLAILAFVAFTPAIVRNAKTKGAYMIYASIVLVLIQCSMNRVRFGDFTISYIDAVTYYGYLGSRAQSLKEGTTFTQENNPRFAEIAKLPPARKKVLASSDMRRQLTGNTINFAKAYALNLFDNSKSGATAIADCRNVLEAKLFAADIFFWISKWQNRILSLAGILLGIYFLFSDSKHKRVFQPMAVFILYTILLSGVSSSQGDRFHLITFPFTMILGTVLLQDYTRRRENYERRAE